jgi:hypothetical protein
MEVFPGWHVRVHRVQLNGFDQSSLADNTLELVDSGFALDAETAEGAFIPNTESLVGTEHGCCVDGTSCLLRLRAGTAGIVDLTPQTEISTSQQANVKSKAFMLRADPNTNLIVSRTFIPSVRHEVPPVGLDGSTRAGQATSGRELWLATGVFAVAGAASVDRQMVLDLWRNRPNLKVRLVDDDLEITVL